MCLRSPIVESQSLLFTPLVLWNMSRDFWVGQRCFLFLSSRLGRNLLPASGSMQVGKHPNAAKQRILIPT